MNICTTNNLLLVTSLVASLVAELQELCQSVVNDGAFESDLQVWIDGDKKLRKKLEKFFFGKVMAKSRGLADAGRLREALLVVLGQQSAKK